MLIKGIIDENLVDYKKPSMSIMFPFCTFKCEKECGESCCHNSSLATSPTLSVSPELLVDRFIQNPITKAFTFMGLEPLDSFEDVVDLIEEIRKRTDADIVIYTGYRKEEIVDHLIVLARYKNIIVKFGRFVPNQKGHHDDVLGVQLANDEQFAERIS